MSAPPRVSLPPVLLPPLSDGLDRLWDLILDIAEKLPAPGWALVGGQMVMLHGLIAGRTAMRASQDVDLLADLATDPNGAQGGCLEHRQPRPRAAQWRPLSW